MWDTVDALLARYKNRPVSQNKREVGEAVPAGRMGRPEDHTGCVVRSCNPQNLPEFELTTGCSRSVRNLQHGYPDPQVRWHYHDDYELHNMVASSGKLFVGDYIGRFSPVNRVLTGFNCRTTGTVVCYRIRLPSCVI